MTSHPALVLFVDGFAFDYLDVRPFLPGFWQDELPVETLIGYSSSIVPALWSGLYPDQLGIWTEFSYGPRTPYRLPRLMDRAPHPYLRDALRLALYRYGTRDGRYQHYLPAMPADVEHLFCRANIRYEQFPPVPLGEAGLDARLRCSGRTYHSWYSGQHFSARRALAELEQAMTQADVFIHSTAVVDEAGHMSGADPLSFDSVFRELELFILGAVERLSRKGNPTVIVISDHGMTRIKKRFDLPGWLQPWQLGRDYLAFLDSTMARFWAGKGVGLDEIRDRLETAAVGRFLTARDRDYYGLNFADSRYGDAVFLLEPGCLLSPSFMEGPSLPFLRHPVKAVHGYDPTDPSTRAVFLYHGDRPLPNRPARVTEVADVMEHLLRP